MSFGVMEYMLVHSLLLLDEDPNETDAHGRSALHFACVTDENIAVVKLLADFGADVSAKTAAGETPLSIARKRACPKIERLLLSYGAK